MSNYNDDRYDSEYDNDRQDSLLIYFYNLVVSPRTLGQQIERDPKIFGTALIVYIPFVIYVLKFTSFMSDTMSYSPIMLFLYVIIIVIHICVEIGVVAFILFVLNKLFRGEMRYKEAVSVTLFPRMIIFIGLLLFSFLNEISFGSILIPIALILISIGSVIWWLCIIAVLVEEISYLGTGISFLIAVLNHFIVFSMMITYIVIVEKILN